MPWDTIIWIVAVLLILWGVYGIGYGNGYSQAKWEEFNK